MRKLIIFFKNKFTAWTIKKSKTDNVIDISVNKYLGTYEVIFKTNKKTFTNENEAYEFIIECLNINKKIVVSKK